MIISSTKRAIRHGFTLVEMLVVVAIIGILAGLITAVAVRVMTTAKRAVITVEFSQLDAALKAYKEKYGEYPPDGADQTDANINGIPDSFERHFQRVFPKANLATEPGSGFVSELGILYDKNKFPCNPKDINALRNFFRNYNPSTALAFWLGGMQEDDYSTKATKNPKSRIIGFSSNPMHPLSDDPVTSASRLSMWFEFDPARINDPTGTTDSTTIFRHYLGNVNVLLPYVYFRAEVKNRLIEYVAMNVATKPVKSFVNANVNANAIARPYFDATEKTAQMPGAWVNPTSYQLLFCGFDNTFGKGNWYPGGKVPNPLLPNPPSGLTWNLLFYGYDSANYDDITNFAGGAIGDKMP